ncbi:MAG: excinuclease ABC subunit UvrC [Myxococcales bacterium]|nr:excinuclease ABC subunit UvrC [Myxococcales bacterium]
MPSENVTRKLENLPPSPGVYLFKGEGGVVLYVGKARSLRNRVRGYFQPGTTDVRAFVARLDAELVDLETFVTESEKEAALLEHQLIRKYKPRYNVKLRDDKEYLSLRLDPKAEWPRLEVVRRPKKDRAQYFGPYPSATAARTTLRLVNRYFQLRTCTDTELKNRSRPCLQYQIKRCPGPCVYEVDREAYAEQVRNVGLFLSGRHDELRRELEAKMQSAAKEMRYEDAAVYRDQLKALDAVREKQIVSSVRDVDQDVIGIHRDGDVAEVSVLVVRRGKLVSVHTETLIKISAPTDEIVSSFVLERYTSGVELPDEILLPMDVEAREGLAELLGEERGKRVSLVVPKKSTGARLLELAHQNAVHAFGEKGRKRESLEAKLEAIRDRLRLPKVPRTIECVDISHTGGEETFGAVVAMRDGELHRAGYRSFRVKTVSGGDDYGAMYEVLSRRFARSKTKEDWALPDLLVVDGGKGQLRVALEALAALELEGALPVVALAKEKPNAAGEELEERLYLPGQKNPIPLRTHAAFQLLAQLRDEAHRFSNKKRTDEGRRVRVSSALLGVHGIGQKTERRLLAALGSVDAIRAATEEELVSAGATRRQALAIRAAFGSAAASEEEAIENAFRA